MAPGAADPRPPPRKALGTPAKIYYKYEGVARRFAQAQHRDPAGLVQRAQAGINALTTETGAGQWGTSLSFAGSLFGIQVQVFQVRVSYDQKPYRRAVMETYGAHLRGLAVQPHQFRPRHPRQGPRPPRLAGHRHQRGRWSAAPPTTTPSTRWARCSTMCCCTRPSSARKPWLQLEMAGDDPDVVVGCTGGGSNFAGIAFPFIGQQLRGGKKAPHRGRRAAACPSLTRGKYAYDFGDTGHLTPLTKMHTLAAPSRRRASTPAACATTAWRPWSPPKELGLIEAVAYHQVACFEAGVMFARAEGIVPAPEANHAVRGAINEALRCKAEGKSEVILFNLCGHGHFDMTASHQPLRRQAHRPELQREELAMALSGLPSVGRPDRSAQGSRPPWPTHRRVGETGPTGPAAVGAGGR